MNHDEAILHQTIEQLERLYRIVQLQHEKFYSQNPETFRLFTEGTVDHIKRLIKELDDACGVTAALSVPEPEEKAEESLQSIRKTG